eukprot:1154157-Pelagomonas_calceolata.AAC.4
MSLEQLGLGVNTTTGYSGVSEELLSPAAAPVGSLGLLADGECALSKAAAAVKPAGQPISISTGCIGTGSGYSSNSSTCETFTPEGLGSRLGLILIFFINSQVETIQTGRGPTACGLNLTSARLLPMGSHPRVADKRSTYDLFGPVSKLWSANYDRERLLPFSSETNVKTCYIMFWDGKSIAASISGSLSLILGQMNIEYKKDIQGSYEIEESTK